MRNPWAGRARLTWQKQRCAAVSGPRSSPWPERSNHKAPKRPTSKPQPRPIAARRPQPAPTSPAPGRRPRARRRSPRAAPPRPAPRSALRAPASPADVRRRAPLPTRTSGACLSARSAHAPAYGTPGLQAPPARRRCPSGVGASPEPLLPVIAVLPHPAPCHYEEIEPEFTCPSCFDCLKPKGCWSSAWRAQLHKRFRIF